MTDPIKALDGAIRDTMKKRSIDYGDAYQAVAEERPDLMTAYQVALKWPKGMRPAERKRRQVRLQYAAALVKYQAQRLGVTYEEALRDFWAKNPEMFK